MNDDAPLRGFLLTRIEVLGDELRKNALAQDLGIDKILRNAGVEIENGRLDLAVVFVDLVSVFLRGEAEHAAGAVRDGRKRGGIKTAEARQREAQQREVKLLAAAFTLRAANPRLSNARLAEILAERGHGGKEAIKKLLRKHPRKKKLEGR